MFRRWWTQLRELSGASRLDINNVLFGIVGEAAFQKERTKKRSREHRGLSRKETRRQTCLINTVMISPECAAVDRAVATAPDYRWDTNATPSFFTVHG